MDVGLVWILGVGCFGWEFGQVMCQVRARALADTAATSKVGLKVQERRARRSCVSG